MNNVVLHPATISAINSEMAAYQAREESRLVEVARLQGALYYAIEACREVLKDCQAKPGEPLADQLRKSLHSVLMRKAIDRAETALEEDK